MFRPVESNVSFRRSRGGDAPFSGPSRGANLREITRPLGRPAAICVLRRPADRDSCRILATPITRAIESLPRYQTISRLPVRAQGRLGHARAAEVEVCKEARMSKKMAFGVEPFIQKCQQTFWRHVGAPLTERIGFSSSTRRMSPTVKATSRACGRGSPSCSIAACPAHRLVVGARWHGGSASGEVGQGYREVADPSVCAVSAPRGQKTRSANLLLGRPLLGRCQATDLHRRVRIGILGGCRCRGEASGWSWRRLLSKRSLVK